MDLTNTVRATLRDEADLLVDVAALSEDDDLFDAGLTSLGAVRVLVALEDLLNIEVPETELSRSSLATVASIVALVSPHTAAGH